MKQVIYRGNFPHLLDRVAIVEEEIPSIEEGEVLIDVKVRPINPADLLLIHQRHVFDPVPGTVIGIEGAGIVVQTTASSGLALGQRVAIPFGGTWREKMKFKGNELLAFSEDLSLEQGAMLSVNPVTAYCMLLGLTAGQSILLNAANSAISKLLIQIAKFKGLFVIAVVRRESVIKEVKEAGADLVIVESKDILLEEQVKQVAQGRQIMRAFDAVAGLASQSLFNSVSEGGELIVYGLLADDRVVLPAAQLIFRDVIVKGFSRLRYLRAMNLQDKQDMMDCILTLFLQGKLLTEIERTFDLSEAKQAIEAHENPKRKGKILLLS